MIIWRNLVVTWTLEKAVVSFKTLVIFLFLGMVLKPEDDAVNSDQQENVSDVLQNRVLIYALDI